jgi:hypothetical protein
MGLWEKNEPTFPIRTPELKSKIATNTGLNSQHPRTENRPLRPRWRRECPLHYPPATFVPVRQHIQKPMFIGLFYRLWLSRFAIVRYNPACVLGHVLGQRSGLWCAKSTA